MEKSTQITDIKPKRKYTKRRQPPSNIENLPQQTRPYGSEIKRDTTGENPYRRVNEKDLGKLLEQSGGFVSVVAKQIGTSIQNVEARIKRSPYLQGVQRGIRATMVDIAEAAIVKAVKEGDMTATIFTLKCLGKDRGWIEKQAIEMDHVNERPPVVFSLIAQDRIDEARKAHESVSRRG